MAAGAAGVVGAGPYQYFLSSDINLPVAVNIVNFHEVEVPRADRSITERLLSFLAEPKSELPIESDQTDVYLTLELYCEGKPVCSAIPVLRGNFRKWHRFSIKYKDLTHSAQIVITLWACHGPLKAIAIAGTAFPLFNRKQTLRKGKHKLRLWEGVAGDGSCPSTTPGKITARSDHLWRMETLVQQYKQGRIAHEEWLDKITFKQIAETFEDAQRSEEERRPYMYVEFPTFEQAVVFHQRDNDGCNPAPTALSFMPLDEDRRFEPPEMHELISSAVDVICPNGFQQPSASSPMMMTTAAVGGAEHHQHANGPLPSVGQGVGGAAPGEALANASGSVNEAEGPYSPDTTSLLPSLPSGLGALIPHLPLPNLPLSGVPVIPTLASIQGLTNVPTMASGDFLPPSEKDARDREREKEREREREREREKSLKIVVIHDPELTRDNPVEKKYFCLLHRDTSFLDKDLKPSQAERNELNRIIAYPSTKQLVLKEKRLVWRFRYYLRTNSAKALTKFARCVDWNNRKDVQMATELMHQWDEIEVADALELLSASFRGIDPVRRYAISCLGKANDEALMMYLLQLVQALRYDKGFLSDEEIEALKVTSAISEGGGGGGGGGGERKVSTLMRTIRRRKGKIKDSEGAFMSSSNLGLGLSATPLAEFLVHRAILNPKLGNFLYWYLVVEAPEPGKIKPYSRSYDNTLAVYKEELSKTQEGQEQLVGFDLQGRLYVELTDMWQRTREISKFSKKEEMLRQWLEPYRQFRSAMPLPHNPGVFVNGIIPEKARIFTSAKTPFRLVFTTTNDKTVAVLFKAGDDLRQDQLIVQLVTLMDNLLKQVQVDLALTPYAVLAMSSNGGMVEFVENSETLSDVLAAKGNYSAGNHIQNFLREQHPDKNGPYGIDDETMRCFIKSVAGYCVITYILGVGDRHNHNLLIRHNGSLFHIDFGFILGQEPFQRSILPPPFKLTPQMVEAMGGQASSEFYYFKMLCSTAFRNLRQNSNLIINLLSLMVDADIPGIAALGGERSILKVQEKFFQDMSADTAAACFQDLIQSSISNVMAQFWDFTHELAVKRKG